MKILSYNVNGLRSFCKPAAECDPGLMLDIIQNGSKMSGLREKFPDYDVYCFQETKVNDDRIVNQLLHQWADYEYWLSFNELKPGYAGVLNWVQNDSIKHNYVCVREITFPYMGDSTYTEGRILEQEYSNFYLINVYVPNSGNKNELRIDWDNQFKNYILSLTKPVIICGDLNVCSTELDYWGNYKKAINSGPGLMDFEISGFTNLINECGLIDVFRYFNPDLRKYSWFTTRNKQAVESNKGWRLDYFLVSKELINKVKSVDVCQGFQSPDHSPIIMEIDI